MKWLLLLLLCHSAFAAEGRRGMVASADSLATRAGLSILQQGGSAADAAIATALALGVCEPYSSGIGGGLFIVTRSADSGKVEALSGRETAPVATRASDYLDAEGEVLPGRSSKGVHAVAVPGALQALDELHREKGRLPWAVLVEPARRLAAEGFVIRSRLAAVLAARDSTLKAHSGPACGTWWHPDGRVLGPGDTLRQPELARSLARIAVLGARTWIDEYFAPALEKLMLERGGPLRASDLRGYRVTAEECVSGGYRDWTLHSIGSPSSGGALLVQMLGVLEGLETHELEPRSAQRVDIVSRVMEYAFADRARWFGDDRFTPIPLDHLLSPVYADSLRRLVLAGQRTDAAWPGLEEQIAEGDHTTHLCVVDSLGNAVSLTATINTWFGSCITEPRTGVVLNNEMDDFVMRPGVPNSFGLVGSPRNAVRPGARPLSSMSPLIVTRGDRLVAVLGSEGGPKIISTVLNLCLELLDHGLSPEEALALPRFHQQWRPASLHLEPGFDGGLVLDLEARGWQTDWREVPWSTAQVIRVHEDGLLQGAADPRANGSAAGY